MLYIITDLNEKEWLKYVLEEFKRIQKVKFEIKIVSIKDINKINKNSYLIYYTKKFYKSFNIVNMSDLKPSKDIKYISNTKFIFNNLITNNNKFDLEYDLFWNSFIFLSRYEEYNHNKKINSYCINHPRTDKSSFTIPIVNILFNELENIIIKNYPKLKFDKKNKPIIELSHDVDYIKKTFQLRIKQTIFNTYNTIKNILKPNLFFKNFIRTLSFFFSNPTYWHFDYWINLELKYNKKSVFYFYSKTKNKNLISWLINPSYDIQKNVKLQKKVKELISKGFEIGLHGSYYSSEDYNLLKKEKKILEKTFNIKINKIRQHWLRYNEKKTPNIHNKLFRFDSTLGFNDQLGFRSGCASQYRPYDHKNNRPFNFYKIPFIIMDSIFFDYNSNNNKIQKIAMDIIKNLKNYKSVHTSICWHQRVASKDYKWHNLYEQIIAEI